MQHIKSSTLPTCTSIYDSHGELNVFLLCFKCQRCANEKTSYAYIHNLIHNSARSQDKGLIKFMLALHESREKTQSKNPIGGKKAHGKKPK